MECWSDGVLERAKRKPPLKQMAMAKRKTSGQIQVLDIPEPDRVSARPCQMAPRLTGARSKTSHSRALRTCVQYGNKEATAATPIARMLRVCRIWWRRRATARAPRQTAGRTAATRKG